MDKIKYITSNIRGHTVFDTKEKAEKILRAICSSYKEFVPERYGEDIPFISENLEGPIKYLACEYEGREKDIPLTVQLVLERKSTPKSMYVVNWEQYSNESPIAFPSYGYYHIDETYLKDKNNLKKWEDYTHKLFEAHEGWFGYISCEDEEEYKIDIFWNYASNPYADPDIKGGSFCPGTALDKGIPGIFWGNYFNSFYVNWFGRDKFDTLPCVKKEMLPNGAIFFTTAETPFDWNTEECKKMQKEVIEHLGKDAFFDMEGLRREIKEKVIKKGIKGVDYFNKIEELAKLFTSLTRVPEFPFKLKKNERKKVETEETSPDDAKGITESFENQMKKEAEIYVDIIKKQNNVNLNYTEKDLDAIEEIIEADVKIGHPENYPGTIQVLGSYLGETLIRKFGGKWVGNDPQFNIPAVEINSIRFFPHAKVYKRFENGKSDSLTSFYKVISRKIRTNQGN